MFKTFSRGLFIAYGATALTAAFALAATPKVADADTKCYYCVCGNVGCGCQQVPCKPQ